jgi:hypothetical protein
MLRTIVLICKTVLPKVLHVATIESITTEMSFI